MAVAFAKQDWGLLCMLDDHEHHGLESFAATPEGTLDDGSQVESGSWKASKDDDDPRLFVIVVPKEGKTFVDCGTPQLKATAEVSRGPALYRERKEIQEK